MHNIINKKYMTVTESINSIYNDVKNGIVKKSFEGSDILAILVNTMQLTEKYRDEGEKLSGRMKKTIVLQVISRVVADLPIEGEIKKKVEFFVDFLMPVTIDLIVAASKSQIAINVKKKFKEKCLCCVKSAASKS